MFCASPDSDAVTGELPAPAPTLPAGTGATCPKLGVVPYSKTYDVAVPCASTVPLSCAVVLATAVAAPVVATGALVPPVVKHFNAPVLVPNPFVATSRKQYVVPGINVPAGRLTANGPPVEPTRSTAVIVFRLDPTPYSNMNAVWPPPDGSTVPLKVAPVEVIDVADPVVATGVRLTQVVVKLRSTPTAVPRLFVATSRYRYRLIATSARGTSTGAVRTFTTGPFTPPAATTAAATNVASGTATLNATIDPRGQATAFTFEYGTTAAFGNITSVDMLDAHPGVRPVSLPVSGLAAATTYHYRVVATNASGTTTGATLTFTTNAVRSLFWTETVIFGTGSVNVVNRDDPNESEVLRDGIIHAYGIAANADHVFWGNLNTAAIGRIDVDGTDANPSFIATTSPPVAMAVTSTHIYWANFDANTIGRANLDGTGVNNSFIATGSGPSGVAVNASHIYWTHQTDDTIGRANLDGTGVNNTLVTGANNPDGITLDGTHIYWGNSTALGRANLDGTGVNHSFVPGTSGVGAVAVDSTHIYYANWTDNAIARANLDGTGLVEIWKQLGSQPNALAIPAA